MTGRRLALYVAAIIAATIAGLDGVMFAIFAVFILDAVLTTQPKEQA